MYYSKQQEKFLDNLKAKYSLIHRRYSTVQTMRFLINEATLSYKGLDKIKIWRATQDVKLSIIFISQPKVDKKPFIFLDDSSVFAVVSKSSETKKQYEKPKPVIMKTQNTRVLIDDKIFEKELKPFIKKSEPLEEHCKKYFKNFFCENGLSPSMRRWLWRERIGNPLRMNRTLFNTWCSRTARSGICAEQEAVIKADLVRACACLDHKEDKVKIFEELEKLITAFVVRSSHPGIQTRYRLCTRHVGRNAAALQSY